MITLNFTQTPDFDIAGEYTTYKNDLLIGQDERADLPINDSKIDDIHCILKLSNNQLAIKSIPNKSFYLLNGKKFSGEHLLKPQDEIHIGDTIFKIEKFIFDPQSTPSSFKEAYKQAIKQFPETAILLEVLEREITYLEQNSTETK